MRRWLDAEAASEGGLRVHFPIEIRWTCGDDIWLSPSYGRETTYIGVVTYRYVGPRRIQKSRLEDVADPFVYRPYGLPVPYRQFHEKFAALLASYDGRPHWAKQHALKPNDIKAMYPKIDDYRRVIQRVDPDGIMRSEYVRRHIEGEDVAERLFKRRP